MRKMKQKGFQIILAALILVVAFFAVKFLSNLKKPIRHKEAERVVPIVKVFKVSSKRHVLTIWEYATVQPVKKIDLVAQVSGKIVHINKKFVVGGRFSRGEEIIKVDPTDYKLALKLAESNVKQAENLLEKELAESEVSKREWIESEGTTKIPRLVARRPQVEAARAKLEAAKAQLEKAKLNLERTSVIAPFDCIVSSELADLGQYVTPARILSTLFYSGEVEMEVLLKEEDVQWINVPGLNVVKASEGSEAIVLFRVGGEEYRRKGRVVRWNNFLDEVTRLFPVVVQVESPYEKQPPLAVGTFVHVGIKGKPDAKAFVIPTSALRNDRKGNTIVWIVDKDSTLRFRAVKVAYQWRDRAYIISGLKGGELLITSPLNLVSNGMKVKPVYNNEDSDK